MIKVNKDNLHFLWRENYIAYLWANNVTAPAYFLHSGILLFEDNVLTAYATSAEIDAVSKMTHDLVEKSYDILKLKIKFTEIKKKIKEQKKNYTKKRVQKAPNKELHKLMEDIFKMYREFVSAYRCTEPHYVRYIEELALEVVRKKTKDKGSAEQVLSNILANNITSQNLWNKQFTKEEMRTFKLLQAVARMRFRAKTIDAPLVKCADTILQEISKRSFIALNQLSNLSPSDFKNLLLYQSHPNMNIVNKRQHHFAVSVSVCSTVLVEDITGQKLTHLLEFDRGQSDITTLSGSVAYPGKVIGVAKLVPQLYGAAEFTKFISTLQQKDILIAPMTSPNITPAFSKVSAVITDEGGLMSHAALVAREEKIPCIVGTKIATRIFKDGDKLLIDTEKKMVEKISKTK